MAFDFDEGNPSDDYLIPDYPGNERAHRTAVKGAVDVEHDSAEGRHKIAEGVNLTRDGITTWVNGSIFVNTQTVSGDWVLQFRSGGVWKDVAPPANIPRTNRQSRFSVCQFGDFETITPGAGSPNPIAVNLNTTPRKKVTLTADSILSNPVNGIGPAGTAATGVTLEVWQSTGGHVLTFGTSYRGIAGATPVIASGAGELTILYIDTLSDGSYLIAAATDVRALV